MNLRTPVVDVRFHFHRVITIQTKESFVSERWKRMKNNASQWVVLVIKNYIHNENSKEK